MLTSTPPSLLRNATVRVAAPSVHIVQSTRVLLAAAPTTPPCFRRWQRSSSLPSRGGLGREAALYAMPRAPLLAGAVAVGDWGVLPAPAPPYRCIGSPFGRAGERSETERAVFPLFEGRWQDFDQEGCKDTTSGGDPYLKRIEKDPPRRCTHGRAAHGGT